MTEPVEQKIVRFIDAEMRASDTEEMAVEGYALKFEKETVIGKAPWGWREKIARTALDGAAVDNVVFDFNHSWDNVLARTTNRSLELIVDSIGLKILARIVDTTIGRDVYKLIKEGLITRMSFQADIKKSDWTFIEDGGGEMDSRVITAFDRFYDVSAVTFPAYEDTVVAVRSDEVAARQRQIYEKQVNKLKTILGGKRNGI